MFKCDLCKEQQNKGVKPVRLVVEQRPRVYTNAKGEVVGTGWEIVKEVAVCPGCASTTARQEAA